MFDPKYGIVRANGLYTCTHTRIHVRLNIDKRLFQQ